MKDLYSARPGDTITNGSVELLVTDVHDDDEHTWITTAGAAFPGFPSSAHSTLGQLSREGFEVAE